MARNGVGIYSLPATYNPVVTNTPITIAWANNTLTDIATAVTNSIASNGETVIAANLPMSGYRHTGVSNAALRDQYAAAGQVQDNTFAWGGTAGGTADALTLTLSPAITAYAAGQRFDFIVGASPNATTTPTLAVNGLTAKTIVRKDGSALAAGDLPAGMRVSVLYDGTSFRIDYITSLVTFKKLSVSGQSDIVATSPADTLTVAAGTGTTITTNAGTRTLTIAAGGAGISTVGSTITGDYTITGTTPTYFPVATTALGKCVTAPDATTLSLGIMYVLDNSSGTYPIGFRDFTGALVGKNCIGAGGVAQVWLRDKSTAAGVWELIGNNLEPGLITIDSTFSSTYASTVLAPFVALDSNTSIHFAALSSGFAAFVVDNTGKAVSTPVTVDATAGMSPIQCFKVSTTSAIVFYDDGSSAQKTVILTLTGTTPSYSLSVGTSVALTALRGQMLENFTGAPKIAQLSSTLYLASSASAVTTIVQAFSVSGATITAGATANIIAANSVLASTTTYAMTATTALVLYASGAGTPWTNNAVVVSVSGTTCTVGTPQTVGTQIGGGSAIVPMSALLSATKAIVITDDNVSTQLKAYAITVSGTSISVGAAGTVETGGTGIGTGSGGTYTGFSATRYNPHLFPLSASTALLWYFDSSAISRAVVLSESGGTVTAGTKMYNSISIAVATTVGGGAIIPQGTSEFVAIRAQSAAGTFDLMPHKINGTTITTGSGAALREIPPTRVDQVWFARLASGDYVHIGGSVNTSTSQMGVQELPVFRSNGDAVNVRGRIKVPALMASAAGATWSPVALSSNRLAILGATVSSTVSTSTFQLRLLNVEIAA
jgi:hypothetical protein